MISKMILSSFFSKSADSIYVIFVGMSRTLNTQKALYVVICWKFFFIQNLKIWPKLVFSKNFCIFWMKREDPEYSKALYNVFVKNSCFSEILAKPKCTNYHHHHYYHHHPYQHYHRDLHHHHRYFMYFSQSYWCLYLILIMIKCQFFFVIASW